MRSESDIPEKALALNGKEYNLEKNLDKAKRVTEGDYTRYLLIGIWILLILWRFYMLVAYCYKYVDDDQALMWYGTVHFAHGHFPEPCFFGQSYNSMIESLLAVPLYLCGWPLNYALPTAVTVTSVFPFMYCSIACWRRKKYGAALAAAILFSMTAWQWDLLTSIPHAVFSGFPWAVLGVDLMCDPKNGKAKRAIGSGLCAMGTVATMSTAAIMGIAWLYYVLSNGKAWRRYAAPVTGMMPAVLLFLYEKWYYSVHSEDVVIQSSVDLFNKDAFLLSIHNLPQLFEYTFGFGRAGVIIIPVAIVAVCVYWFKQKDWKMLILAAASVMGSMVALSIGWMTAYDPNCVLLPQSRMVIFWVFLVLEFILFLSYSDKEYLKINGRKGILMAVAGIVVLCIKAGIFAGEVKNPDSTIYRSGIVRVMSVEELSSQAGVILDVAESLGAEVLVTTEYSRVMAYGASALYYEVPIIFYVPDSDRRVWVYNDLLSRKNTRLLLYSMPVDENMALACVDLENETVPGYIWNNYGVVRGGDYVWGKKN